MARWSIRTQMRPSTRRGGRLADGFPIRDAPNTWHLMAVEADGSGMSRFAWTPRYPSALTNDGGLDTYNAVQPAVVQFGGELLVAYTTQRDQTMAHSTPASASHAPVSRTWR
jgi:hypothetical protein